MRATTWSGRTRTTRRSTPTSPGPTDPAFSRPSIGSILPAGQLDAPESEWVPFDHATAYARADRGLYGFSGELMPTNETLGLDEDDTEIFDPDALSVDTLWEALAWSFNWFLPDLPVVRNMAESYINTAHWHWGGDLPEVEGLTTPLDIVAQHWDFWGLGTPSSRYAGNNMVWADPDNPKLGADIRRT